MRYMILVKADAGSAAGAIPTEALAHVRAALVAGYTIIKVNSEQEAREWTRRFPNPTLHGSDCHIEVRRV